jgi:excisionase family DNA binding protein
VGLVAQLMMTRDDLDRGPRSLRFDLEARWRYIGVRADLIGKLVALGHLHRRSGTPLDPELLALFFELEARAAEVGNGDEAANMGVSVGRNGQRAHESMLNHVFLSREVAGLLGLSQRRVVQLATVGQLRGRRAPGGSWLIDADSVDEWLAARPERGN